MGKFSRDKGLRMEREIVHAFQEAGLHCERVPLSGAAGGKFAGDISFAARSRDWTAEVKARADGFAKIYDWLGSNDALFIRRDRDRWLAVVPLSTLIEVLK